MEPDILLRAQLSRGENEQDIYSPIDFSEMNKITCTVSSNEPSFIESQMLSNSNVNHFHSYAKTQDGVPVSQLELVEATVQSGTCSSVEPATDVTIIMEETLGGTLIGAPITHIPQSVDMSSNFSACAGLNAGAVGVHLGNTDASQTLLGNVIAAGQVQMVDLGETAMETGTAMNESEENNKNNSAVTSNNISNLATFSTGHNSSNSLDVLCNVQLMTFSCDNQEPRIKLVRVTNAIVLSVQFICKACGKDFLSAEALRIHTESHTSEAPNQPENPSVSTINERNVVLNKTPVDLRQNLVNRSINKTPADLNCQINDQAMPPRSENITFVQSQIVGKHLDSACLTLMDDQKGEDLPIFNQTCFICKKMFNCSELWHHYSSVHLQDDYGWQCFMCGKQQPSEKELLLHLMSLHARLREPSPFCCAVCDRRFDSHTFLLNHMLHDHPLIEGAENPLTLLTGRKTSAKSPGLTEKPVKLSCAQCEGTGIVSTRKNPCRICGKLFWDSRQLTRHLSEHNEQTLCTVCHKVVFLKSLPKHMTLHTKPKSFECPECKKAYRDKCDLTKHMRTHTGEKPYTCEICHKSFTHSSQLPRHLRTHTGEKPFKCDLCNKVFSRRFGLQQHMSIHSGDKLFKCSLCGKEFRNWKGLQKHARKHSPEIPS